MTTLYAPAKLTLTLRITGARDDGYHLIDAEMVTLDFADRLDIGLGDSLVVVDGDGARPGTPDDLVRRALRITGRVAAIRLSKRIPVGAGLGGGSADAAAILRWAGELDPAIAASLGADVPFCVVGGRARVRGIGEIVEPLPFEPRTLTLLTPPFGCSTADVYRTWDTMGGPSGPHGNDLELAALAVEPRLAEWRTALAEVTGLEPRLAGSGSTWFVEGEFPGDGRRVVHTTPDHDSYQQ